MKKAILVCMANGRYWVQTAGRAKNATRSILFGIILKCYQIVVPFLMRTAMIQIMGVQYLGLGSLYSSILQVLNLAELGVGSAMVYSMYKPIAENNKTAICALMSLYKKYYTTIGGAVGVIGLVITPFLPKLINGEVPSDVNIYLLYFLNLLATVISYWLFAYKNCLLIAHQRNDVVSKISLVISSTQYVLQLLVLVLVHNYYFYIMVMLIAQIAINVITAHIVDNMYPEYKAVGEVNIEDKRIINSKIRDLFCIKIGSAVTDSADSIVISAFLGLTTLGIYQNYFMIMNSVYGIVSVIFTSITAAIGNSLLTEPKEKNFQDFKTLTFIMNWVICICCSCFIGLYQPFMKLWVGNDLMLAPSMVALFSVYFYVRQMASIWVTIKDAAGLWHADRFRALIGATVNLTLNLMLVKHIGLFGILLSTIISVFFVSWPWLLHNVFHYIYKRNAMKYLADIGLWLLIIILSCVANAFICDLLGGDIVCFASKIMISVIIPNIIMLLLMHQKKEFKIALQIIHRGLK